METKLTTVGVVGGGQLAWMMAQEAPKLGLKLAVQTPQENDPAVALAEKVVLAAIADGEGTKQLAEHCGVITFENEFVDLLSLEKLAQQGVSFYPRLDSLAPLLDKWEQRHFLHSLNLPVPDFWALESLPSPLPAFPWVLKARRHGYDGQGTQIISSPADLPDLGKAPPGSWMVENFVPYERELAVIGARNAKGEVEIYPVVETHQVNQVCRWVVAPAPIDAAVAYKAQDYCRHILDHLDYVGILAIEFFLLPESPQNIAPEQRLLINELAPRTHNSGHFSLDACQTSQFALQLEAVTGKALGSSTLLCGQAVMVNLLGYEISAGDYQQQLERLAALPHSHVHWYGKGECRPGRKLGHVTMLNPNLDPYSSTAWAESTVKQLEAIWYPD
ncbi:MULTISPECIES: 5-(carboxyamino)imidazole ribonucleotide synthase [unclassified Synechocystis]|uniref:5-(carboxyamino)imidazole ribonucleotide synthase n=1 Tax=unclassified Synechocystis TaxID=2640012 RepID=UPI00040D0CDA|nr:MULTISPECIES: 5-(carboxyamino)imidazole ribonucleotide synthase [unclassified Synechocystis]AIE75276.1 Phosphoribosylaminoimidazole carboxylase ATPase subunit [Synechocystis sp. PCC 6714]MCT0253018.1 5-(carboxyamino)imidazole ribonucleotide synthase [Synechocystis sp. CS-94]